VPDLEPEGGKDASYLRQKGIGKFHTAAISGFRGCKSLKTRGGKKVPKGASFLKEDLNEEEVPSISIMATATVSGGPRSGGKGGMESEGECDKIHNVIKPRRIQNTRRGSGPSQERRYHRDTS